MSTEIDIKEHDCHCYLSVTVHLLGLLICLTTGFPYICNKLLHQPTE